MMPERLTRMLLTMLLSCICLFAAGCAGLPSNFANENPPLSAADVAIVKTCVTIRTGLPALGDAISISVPLAINKLCKTTVTQNRIGGFVNTIGVGLSDLGNGTIPSTDLFTKAEQGLNTTVNLSSSDLSTADTIITSVQGTANGIYAHLTSLANSATNPDVKAYCLQTLALAFQQIGQSLASSTSGYVTSANTSTAMLTKYRAWLVSGRLEMLNTEPHWSRITHIDRQVILRALLASNQ